MEKLMNVSVKDAYEGKSGVSKYGPWQAWNVYLEGYEEKFGYFEKDHIVPFVGMQIALLEYEVEQKGEYTNYTIKKLVPVQLGDPASAPKVPQVLPVSDPVVGPSSAKPSVSKGLVPTDQSKSVLMCTSYVKDIMVELIKISDSSYRHAALSDNIKAVGKGGKLLAKLVGGTLPPMPMGGEGSVRPVTMTKLQPEDTAGGTNTTERPPVVSKETVKALSEKAITPEMVKLANDALPGTTSDQSGDSIPDDDIPF